MIIKPILTEKAMKMIENKVYCFYVDIDCNRTQVRKNLEKIFDVKIEKVNILNVRGKFKRRGKITGFTRKRKKAIVKLKKDSKDIEFFSQLS
ncbi:MAG: 50S ribosomal protein L23 [Clostridiales bacterium]|jgi:large subunit ribosomal protein L23|nr:50S ribosomal protein L23 [Clostridiales bacterium]